MSVINYKASLLSVTMKTGLFVNTLLRRYFIKPLLPAGAVANFTLFSGICS